MTDETLFHQALSKPPAERAAFLDLACKDQPELRVAVDGLLSFHEASGAFLDKAPVEANPLPAPSDFTDFIQPKMKSDVVLGGRYSLLEKIGEGGMGEVWVAKQSVPVKRRVALKLIKTGMDSKAVLSRFEQERQALAMMDHPNIAKVLDGGMTPTGQPFFVMELVNGLPLIKYCDEAKLTPRQRLELFVPICQAVQHAHQKGIVHRDLKPANILVTVIDGVGVPKVIDFGVAKATAGKLTEESMFTQFGSVVGTLEYMAPEQAGFSGEDIDTRADIYSLGVILYELLTGLKPIDAARLKNTAMLELIRVIKEEDPLRPSTRLSRDKALPLLAAARCIAPARLMAMLRGELDWVVMKCLEKKRDRRYETANGLAADIRRYLENEPVAARPPSTAYRLQKAWQRNRLAFSAAGVVVATLLIGIATSTWQAVRATNAESEQSRLRAVSEQALSGEKVQRAQAEAERQRAGLAQAEAEANAGIARDTAIKARRSQYAADMFAATTQIERGGFLTARNFLREYFPREGMEELRGFEWRYWWQLSVGQQLKTLPLTGAIRDMAWSPDGQLIAASDTTSGSVKLLRPATGEVLTVLKDGSGRNGSLAFSHDGHGLATGGTDKETKKPVVCFWDVRDGRLMFTYRADAATRVACSPAGPLMAIGTGGDWWGLNGKEVHLVDTTSGKVVRVLPKSGDRAVFSPDGKWIATANYGPYNSGTQAVILWDVVSGEKLRVLENHRQVLGMAFSPDGSLLAIGTRRGQVTLWNLHDFSHVILRQQTKDYARTVAFSPDGRRLAVGLQTQEVEIWDVPERQIVKTLRGHTGELTAVGYSPDGTQLASACDDGTIRLWDPNPSTIQKLIPNVKGDPTFSPDSRSVAVAMKNGDAQIVDPATADWDVRKVLPNAGLPVAFSGDATTLLTLTTDRKTVHRWNVASGAELSTTTLDSTKGKCSGSAATQDGSRLALAYGTHIEVFETRSGRRLASFEMPTQVASLEFSFKGDLLAIGGAWSAVLWDITAGRTVWTAWEHHTTVTSMRFSPDQKMIATTSWDATVRLWDVATGKRLATLTGHKAGILNSIFSPDGRTLITGSDDRSIKFWNLAALREVASIPLTHANFILAFSPDGQTLLTNGEDASLRCWRAPSLAEIDAAEAKEKKVGRRR